MGESPSTFPRRLQPRLAEAVDAPANLVIFRRTMRALLSFLLCFVFLESQVFAVHQQHFDEGGGPVPNVVGTYAGVLLPDTTASTDASSSTASTSDSTNSIGVFDLSVPESGIGAGTFIAFSGGRQFNGTIDAVADPDFGALRGVLQATFDFTLSVPTTTTTTNNGVTTTTTAITDTTLTATLSGNLNAAITATTGFTFASNPSSARIDGTAHLDVNFGGVNSSDFSPTISQTLDFVVVGFKQSDTATSSGGGTSSGA